MNKYTNFLAMISTEFQRYLMEHEEVSNTIPPNALVIFQVKGEDSFNKWNRKISLKNRETGQTIYYVHLKGLRRHSLIEEVDLEEVMA
ncbi:MAG: DUF5647 family protein [bacterium]